MVDDEGQPVPHAGVRVWELSRYEFEEASDDGHPPPCRSVGADEAGVFTVEGLGTYALLDASAPGMAPLQCLEGQLRPDEVVSGRRLRLISASSIRGRVIGVSGEPLSDWVVTARKAPWEIPVAGFVAAPPLQVTTTTAADGTFQLEPLAPGSWWVSCEESSIGNWARWVETGGRELDIQLESPFTVPLTVIGTDGAPVPHAKLVVAGTNVASWHALGFQVQLETDDTGEASIPALMEADEADVVVAAPGCELATWHAVQVRREMPPLEFRVQPELVIAGVVVDDDGLPVPAAEVWFDRLTRDGSAVVDAPWRNQLGARWTRCDADGRFVLRHLGAADYWLTVVGPDAPVRHSYAIAAAGTADLRLRQFGSDAGLVTVTGKFREALTGKWISQAFVYLEAVDSRPLPRGAWMPGGGFSQFDGEYTIEGAPPGRYRLCASEVGDAHARWEGPITDFKAGRYEINIDLLPARTLALRVTTSAGLPVGGAAVHFTTPNGEPLPLDSEPQGDGTIGVTDRYGEIVGTRLPATVIGVVISPPPGVETTGTRTLVLDLATYAGGVVETALPAASGR